MAGHAVPEIAVPPACAALWADFFDLSAFRDDGRRVKPSEIEAYARLTGRAWQRWEIGALMEMDRMWVKTFAEEERFTRERRDHERELARNAPRGSIP